MALEERKILDKQGLGTLVEQIKVEDAKVLEGAKAYADGLADNYDAAGTAETKVQELANGTVKANTEAITKAQGEVDALEEVVGGMYTNTQIDEAIATAKSEATYDDTQIKSDIKANADAIVAEVERAEAAEKVNADAITSLGARVGANETAINTLNGEGEGSIKKTVDDAINKFATDVTNDEVVNSYKELIDWVAEHGSEAAEMAAGIEANKTSIEELEALVGALPEGATATTVVALIQELVAAEKARAEGVEAGLAERLATVEGKFEGEGSVDAKIEAAKQEAINTASGDATSKANQALVDAKAYADEKDIAMDARVDVLESTVAEGGSVDTAIKSAQKAGDDAATAAAQAQSDVDAVEIRVEEAEGKVTTLEGEMDSVEGRLDSLESVSYVAITEEEINSLFAAE